METLEIPNPSDPPQPVVRCDGYRPREKSEQDTTQGEKG